MNTQLKPSAALVQFVKGFETFVPYPYDDKVPARGGKYPEWTGGKLKGTATIGYGHTNSGRHPLKVTPGARITEATASLILAEDLSEAVEAVKRQVKVPLTQGQFDALVSFTFNCGEGNLKNIARRLNAKDYDGARAALALYNKSSGEVMRGLTRRRKGEQALWDDDSGSKNLSPDPAPTENAPEKVDKPKTPITIKGVVAGVVGGGATVGAVKEVADTVAEVAEPVRTATESVTGILSLLSPSVIIGVVVIVAIGIAVGIYLPKR